MPNYQQLLSFRDAKGFTSWVRFWCNGTGQLDAGFQGDFLTQAILPLTNAALQRLSGAYTSGPTAPSYGSTSLFSDCADKATFWFTTAEGVRWGLVIPAPKAALFLADGETIDRSNALVVTLYGQAINRRIVTREGKRFTGFVGGLRSREELARPVGLYRKNPQLTTPGN